MKMHQSFKNQWVKMIIHYSSSQDVDSNQSQKQITGSERILMLPNR